MLVLVPALPWLPTLVPVDPSVASAASEQGYSTPTAFHLVVAWSALLFGVGWAGAARLGKIPDTDPGADTRGAVPPWLPLVILLVAIIAYLPPALARVGPLGEDALMLAVLHRMAHGQVPYLDFEFLYGPLLIVPVEWLLSITGYSARAYYWVYAVLQGVGMALLCAVVVRHRPVRWWWPALLLLPFFLDTLLGINWFGLRRLLPVLLLLYVARHPVGWRPTLIAGLGAGALLGYSHDYAIAAVVAITVLGMVEAWAQASWRRLLPVAAFGVVAVATWAAIVLSLLGVDGVRAYVATSRELVGRFSLGEAGFAFRWTLNSLALFGLMALGIARVATRWRHATTAAWLPGDRLLFLSLPYAGVLLKAGLNRSDIYHFDPPFLALIAGVVLLPPRGVFAFGHRSLAAARVLVGIAAATALLAQLPIGSYLARNLLAGTSGWITRRPVGPAEPVATRTIALLTEQQDPDADAVALAEYLALPGHAGRPVYFYAATYGLPPIVGVEKRHYINDDFMYSHARGNAERQWLEARRDALVVIRAGQWERLLEPEGNTAPDEYGDYLAPSLTKRVIGWLASPHLAALPYELTARERRWRETVGPALVGRYRTAATFGGILVLEPVPALTASRTP